jgi:hypothetical protein
LRPCLSLARKGVAGKGQAALADGCCVPTRLYPAPRAQLRNALYGVGNGPANNATVVFGYARANLRALNFTGGTHFRMRVRLPDAM